MASKIGLTLWNLAVVALVALVAVNVLPGLPVVGDILSSIGAA